MIAARPPRPPPCVGACGDAPGEDTSCVLNDAVTGGDGRCSRTRPFVSGSPPRPRLRCTTFPAEVLLFFRARIRNRMGLTMLPAACLKDTAPTLLWTGTVCVRVHVELGFVW